MMKHTFAVTMLALLLVSLAYAENSATKASVIAPAAQSAGPAVQAAAPAQAAAAPAMQSATQSTVSPSVSSKSEVARPTGCATFFIKKIRYNQADAKK